TSNFLQGIFAVESEMQRERFITYSRDQAFKNLMEYSHWLADPRLVRAIVDCSGETISWLIKCGVQFSSVGINMPDAPHTYHVIKGRGEGLIKALTGRAREVGVDIILDTAVKRIIKSGDKISAVAVEQDGEDRQVKTSTVIICTGGYANHKEWIKKYTGFDLGVNLIVVGNVDKMGEGIRMAQELGAADDGIRLLELYRAGPIGPGFAMACQLEYVAVQPELWVDPRGQRFCDESICFYDSEVGNAAAKIREGYSFTIFDDSVIKRLLEQGVDKNINIDIMPGSRPLDLEKEMQAAFARGTQELFQGESIEELAGKMGAVPEILKKNLEEYNKSCLTGHDPLFAKNPKYLRPLLGPRYYALKARTVFLGTMGGIKINHRAEVVDKKNNVIPGLYAAGFDAGGMYGDSYPIRHASGLSSAFALNSGRIAGINALNRTQK
ncbi:MAG TPA: FAD-binding protein, partial [Dehalococcoidales bacterium]|nr:FAD-binding protein [Dehalococcoidales bacterium]